MQRAALLVQWLSWQTSSTPSDSDLCIAGAITAQAPPLCAPHLAQVGAKQLPSLALELCDAQFSGRLRIKFCPLVGEVVPFGALSLAFMDKPSIDFAFKVGSVDVMALGAGTQNLASLVRGIIVKVLHNVMVSPLRGRRCGASRAPSDVA